MKTLAIGDLHLMAGLILPMVEAHITDQGIQHIVFTGDYTDQWMQTENPELYIKDLQFLLNWKAQKETQGIRVTCLLGNHDIPYLIDKPVGYTLSDAEHREQVRKLLLALQPQISCWAGDFLISHGGYLGGTKIEEWHQEPIPDLFDFSTDAEGVMEVWDKLIELIEQVGHCRGGTRPFGSPVWADAKGEFLQYPSTCYPKQVVGHRPVSEITELMSGNCQTIAIDTFSLVRTPYWPHFFPLSSTPGVVLLEDGQHTIIPIPEWSAISEETIAQYFEMAKD